MSVPNALRAHLQGLQHMWRHEEAIDHEAAACCAAGTPAAAGCSNCFCSCCDCRWAATLELIRQCGHRVCRKRQRLGCTGCGLSCRRPCSCCNRQALPFVLSSCNTACLWWRHGCGASGGYCISNTLGQPAAQTASNRSRFGSLPGSQVVRSLQRTQTAIGGWPTWKTVVRLLRCEGRRRAAIVASDAQQAE